MPRDITRANRDFLQNNVPGFKNGLSAMLRDMSLNENSTEEEKAIGRQLEICIQMMSDASNLNDIPRRGTQFVKAWNEAGRRMATYLEDRSHRGNAVWQALMDHARELESMDNIRRIFVRATTQVEELRDHYFDKDPAQLRQEQQEDLDKFSLIGHEPSLEECHTLSFAEAPLDVLLDRMLWLNAQNARASNSNRDPDSGLYGETLGRLVGELMDAPLDVQAEFLVMASRHELALQSRTYANYQSFLSESPDQSETGRTEYAMKKLDQDPYYEASVLHSHLLEQLIMGPIGDLSMHLKAAAVPSNPYTNPEIETVGKLVNNGILDYFCDKYKKELKSAPKPLPKVELDLLVTARRNELKRPRQIRDHQALNRTPYLRDSGMAQVDRAYEHLVNDRGSKLSSFGDVQRAFRDVYRLRPADENYAAALGRADDALSAYMTEAQNRPEEAERAKFTAELQVALRRNHALEDYRASAELSEQEKTAINQWYDSFVSKAGASGIDLNDAGDRTLVTWYRDNPAYDPQDPTQGEHIPVPAFVPHGGYAALGDTGKLTASYGVDPGWVEENVAPTGKDISLQEKKKLFEMAKQGRLMLCNPLDEGMRSVPVFVTKDGNADILLDYRENSISKEEIQDPPVEPKIVEPGPRPDEQPLPPPSAHGWKRFANAVTFGLAYRGQLRNYAQRRQQRAQEQAAWEQRSAEYHRLTTDGVPNETYIKEHADYEKKAAVYREKLRRYNRLADTYPNYDAVQKTANRVFDGVSRMVAGARVAQAARLGAGLQERIECQSVRDALTHYDAICAGKDTLRLRRTYLKSAAERAKNPKPGVAQVRDLKRREEALNALESIVGMVEGLKKDRPADRAKALKKCYPNLSYPKIAALTPEQEGILALGVIGRVNSLYASADMSSQVVELRDEDASNIVRAQLLAENLDNPEFCKYLQEEFPERLPGYQCDPGTLYEMGMHPEKSHEIARKMAQFVKDKPLINRQIDEVLKKAREALDKPVELVRSVAKALYIRNHQDKKIPIPADADKVEQEVGILEKTFAFNQLVVCHMKEFKELIQDPSRERLDAISEQMQIYRREEQQAKAEPQSSAAPARQEQPPQPQSEIRDMNSMHL